MKDEEEKAKEEGKAEKMAKETVTQTQHLLKWCMWN